MEKICKNNDEDCHQILFFFIFKTIEVDNMRNNIPLQNIYHGIVCNM